MNLNDICGVTLLAGVTLLVLWGNYEAWFRPDILRKRTQADQLRRGLPAGEGDDEVSETTIMRALKIMLVLMDIMIVVAWILIWRMIAGRA